MWILQWSQQNLVFPFFSSAYISKVEIYQIVKGMSNNLHSLSSTIYLFFKSKPLNSNTSTLSM